MNKQYGVRVPFFVDGHHTYLWVCDGGYPKSTNATPLLFSDYDKAALHASAWGPMAYVKEYIPE